MSHFFFSLKFWYKFAFSLLDVDNYARRNEEHEFLLKISLKTVFTRTAVCKYGDAIAIFALKQNFYEKRFHGWRADESPIFAQNFCENIFLKRIYFIKKVIIRGKGLNYDLDLFSFICWHRGGDARFIYIGYLSDREAAVRRGDEPSRTEIYEGQGIGT